MNKPRFITFFAHVILIALFAVQLRAATIEFTDDAGRTRTIPCPVKRVYSTNPIAQIYVYTIAPETMVGVNAVLTLGERRYMLPETVKLPVVGGWFGKNGTANLEILMGTKPDIVLSIGSVNKTQIDFSNNLEKTTGIPVIMLTGDLSGTDHTYAQLGKLFGKPELAAEMGAYCKKSYEEMLALGASVPESERVSFYYAEGPKGLETDHAASWHAEAFRVAGGKNVCLTGGDSGFGRALISMEQVILWKPQAMFIGREKGDNTDEAPDWLANSQWRRIPAFANKRVYQIPDAPFNWIDRPPSVGRIIGIRWAFWCLYPDRVNYDMVRETREFFHLFYHYEMSEAEARKLLQNSKLDVSHE
jgi:iron complex transport system substrate-binding protein